MTAPETGPAQAPAQAACEAFWFVIRGRDGLRNDPADAWPWAEHQGAEKAWKAAAQAAIAAAAPAPQAEGGRSLFDVQADMFVRASEGETVVIGFRAPISMKQAHEFRERFAAAAPGVKIVLVDDVESIDAVAQAAPELAAENPGLTVTVNGERPPSTSGNAVAVPSDIAGVMRNTAAPELTAADDLREQLGVLQDRIGNLAAGLKLSADASRPSKKSEIEDGCATALLGILDPR